MERFVVFFCRICNSHNSIREYSEVKKRFESNEDQENAIAMSKYMRNRFRFYGLSTPKRKEIYNHLIRSEKKTKTIDWKFLDQRYEDPHREFHYLADDYLLAVKQYVLYEDMPKIENDILHQFWWDTIDFLCKVIGDVGLRDTRVKELMINWSNSENI